MSENRSNQRPRRGGGKRTPLSCLPCRQHKLRCDRNVPCGTCIRAHREIQCRQNPAPSQRQQRRVPSEQSLSNVTGPGSAQLSAQEDDNGNDGNADHDDGLVAQGFTGLARLLGLADMDGSRPPSLSLPQLLAEASRTAPLASWWSFLDGHHRQRLWRQQLSALLPSRAQCDLLANYYLEHVNWIFQTVHVPSFRRDYARFWDAGVGEADLVWLSLLLTMLSVSALYVPLDSVEVVGCPRGAIRPLARVWHLAAQHALRAGDYDAKPCLAQLQTFSVMQLYWYATNGIETMNSYLGQAVRNAQAINLDRDTGPSTCLRDEMRHRIWWDLVDSDMFQTICLDRQPLIRLDHPGVPLPLNCHDEDITETSVHPRPLDEPTCMSMNIFRARIFRTLNRHVCARHSTDSGSRRAALGSYQDIRALDEELVGLVAHLPWYFQLDSRGRPPRLAAPFGEVLTWQNHILRTCVSTQRIRMYRPFLAEGVGGAAWETAWASVTRAAEDSLVVYRTLRAHRAVTSRHKFLPQAYQIVSVAVTIATLLLVEGRSPIENGYRQIQDMAADLKLLEDQGCPVPVATDGRQVVLRMLAWHDSRTADPRSPEEAQHLVPDLSIILGGEHTTRAYMRRLSTRHAQEQVPASLSPTRQTSSEGEQGDDATADVSRARHPAAGMSLSPMSLTWDRVLGDYYPGLLLYDERQLGLLSWDMTGILSDGQN